MENSGASRAVRRVRCPRCHCVLEEPGAPVYQCGGCGTTLRAKNRTGDTARASPSRSGLPPQSRHLHGSDVASTSRSSTPTPPPHVGSTSRSGTPPTPPPPHVGTSWHRPTTDATGSGDLALVSPGTPRGSGGDVASSSTTPDATASSRRHQGTDDATRSRRESGGVVSAATSSRGSGGDVASTSSSTPGDTTSRGCVSEQVALIEKRRREQSAGGQEVRDDSEACAPRDAESGAGSHGVVGDGFSGGNIDSTPESQDDTDKGMKRQAQSIDAARKKHSGEAAAVQPKQYHHGQHRQELVPKSSAQPQPARDDADEKAPSPSRHEIQEQQHLGPLRKKILKTVDELKDDLSELFTKSPELNPPRAARPPRLPKQEGYVSRAAAASGLPVRARHGTAATDGHRGSNAARAVKPRQAAAAPPPRGLPSRRYRQCIAYPPCCHHNVDVEPRPCHRHGHGCCCRHHDVVKPECSSCRGYCCRPARAQEPFSAPRKPRVAGKEPKQRRRLPPRNHCRPVLKGAPFIVCSSCFKLVQVPADFAVSTTTRTVRKLRCGSCSTVLSYSYRDPARKKSSVDRCSSTDGSELHLHGGGKGNDPFAPFIDAFGLSSYSTEDEQRLPVSRNTSFDTLDGTRGVGRLHRLMGYGSASELLRHSPDLYESFSERTTPDVRQQHDRKGKGVCIDDDDYDVDDDSDEEDIGALKRSAGKGSSGWPLSWMPGKGTPAAGAIRIK